MLPGSELPLLVGQRVCVVENLDLPCLASGNKLNLTFEAMADLRRQDIAVNDDNDPAPKKILSPETFP